MKIANVKHWLMMCLLLVLATGCEKAPVNDTIEQHWKLVKLTTLSDGVTKQYKHTFFGITRMVTMISVKYEDKISKENYVARTEYRDNESTLVLRDFKVRQSTSDAKKDATVEQLKPFGINNPKLTVFRIVHSSHKRLVLESDYARLELSKF